MYSKSVMEGLNNIHRNTSLYSRIIIETIIKDNYYLFHYFCFKMDRISISTNFIKL